MYVSIQSSSGLTSFILLVVCQTGDLEITGYLEITVNNSTFYVLERNTDVCWSWNNRTDNFYYMHLMPGSGILSVPCVSDIEHGQQEFPFSFYINARPVSRLRIPASLPEGSSITSISMKRKKCCYVHTYRIHIL